MHLYPKIINKVIFKVESKFNRIKSYAENVVANKCKMFIYKSFERFLKVKIAKN